MSPLALDKIDSDALALIQMSRDAASTALYLLTEAVPVWYAMQPDSVPTGPRSQYAVADFGRHVHGRRFISSYYGAKRDGRSIHRPVGTVTTRDRYAIVDGDRIRMFSAQQCRATMGFLADYKLSDQYRLAVHMFAGQCRLPADGPRRDSCT